MISFARFYQDVLLERVFKGQQVGFYIDVGAGDAIAASTTCWFYLRGWRGINIEPHPYYCDRLQRARLEDINLQVAVSDKEMMTTLYAANLPSGQPSQLSTIRIDIAERFESFGFAETVFPVQTATLADICHEYAHNRPLDFLCISTGGDEGLVLQSHDWRDYRPKICVVNSLEPLGASLLHEQWEPHLIEQGYQHVYFDGYNRFYVDKQISGLDRYFQTRPGDNDGVVRFSAMKGVAALDVATEMASDLYEQNHFGQLAQMQKILDEDEPTKKQAENWEIWREGLWLHAKMTLLTATGGRIIPNGITHLANTRKMLLHRQVKQRLSTKYDWEDIIISHAVLSDEYDLTSRRFSSDDVVIDVGAHIGSVSYLCYLLGSRTIHAFEAGEANFQVLQRNLEGLEGIQLHHKAVFRSDVPPTYKLRHSGQAHDNTGGAGVISGGELFDPGTQKIVGKPEEAPWEVDVTSLDDILEPFERIKFLKLDCEGSEFPILLTSKLLHKVERISGEIHEVSAAMMEWLDPHARVNGYDAYMTRQLLESLEASGFEVEILPTPNPHIALFNAINHAT